MSKSTLTALIAIVCLLTPTLIGIIQLQRNLVAAAEFPTDVPVVYVDPPTTSYSPGETFTVSIKIFNLTTNFWQTSQPWERGEELGPWVTYPVYNYSLGNLVGLDVQLGWDDTVLKFVSNTTKIPADQYPDGMLYSPILKIMDNITETSFPFPQPEETKYWLSYLTLDTTKPFNGNGTAVELTFEVLKEGATHLNITMSRLSDQAGEPIPHKWLSGFFRSPGARTRIAKVQAGTLIGDQYFTPAIVGEDVNLSVQIRNDGDALDTYNLTLYLDDEPLQNAAWKNETLDTGESEFFSYGLESADFGVGTYVLSVALDVLHEGEMVQDASEKSLRVIDKPQLAINGPTSVATGSTVTFDASGSSHLDPNGQILNYTWELWGPNETAPRDSGNGIAFTTEIQPRAKNGTYRLVLRIKDNFGVTYSASRPLSSSYETEFTFEVTKRIAGIPYDLIVLGVILIAIIGVAIFYIRRRRR
jgi:hypothetical protein